MIEIKHNKDGITIQGHAEHAPPGQDIVCAAVSTLVQTLVAGLDELTENKITYDMRPGKAIIRYKDLTVSGKLLVESFFIGVNGVADSYPDNVKLSREARPSVEVDKSNQKISIGSKNYGGRKNEDD